MLNKNTTPWLSGPNQNLLSTTVTTLYSIESIAMLKKHLDQVEYPVEYPHSIAKDLFGMPTEDKLLYGQDVDTMTDQEYEENEDIYRYFISHLHSPYLLVHAWYCHVCHSISVKVFIGLSMQHI